MTSWHRHLRVELVLCALGAAALVLLLAVAGPHWPRVAAALLSAALGIGLAVRLTGRRRGVRLGRAGLDGVMVVTVRLTGRRRLVGLAIAAAAGLLLAVAAWDLVPTTTGYSRAGAVSAVQALEGLAAGDADGYRAWLRRRGELLEAFPGLKPRAVRAERAWLERSADQAIAEADARLPDDPRAATARLRRANDDLSQGDGVDAVRGRLREARARALHAALEAARREALAVVARKKDDPDCMRAAAAIARRLRDDFGEEATDLRSDEVEKFSRGYAFLTALEESANRKGR
jgi:hypothetical protein